jgi:hypothetical protein
LLIDSEKGWSGFAQIVQGSDAVILPVTGIILPIPVITFRALLATFILAQSALAATAPTAAAPDFTREVRPILSRYCFKCHGPDDKARKGKLRLDVREEAMKEAKSGAVALVPGKPDESEVCARIFSTDKDDAMPPADTKNPLSEAQKDILKRWIASGAEYKQHWAFIPPKGGVVPGSANPIDGFIQERLAKGGLKLSPEADFYTLCRRIHLDLIGIPPTAEQLAAFVQSATGNRQLAITRLVDELLASPQYGERWARRWLDLARYADSNGYEKDRTRSIWPWRDWVVRALNADMPFDQFTIEQLAGDLLPNPTRDQLVATGFHRNTMLNEEGGIDPLEFRFHAMTDRVATTGATWLGLTLGCAQCHTHKFDPITHREYYSIFAFLNNADEPELDLPPPDVEQQMADRRKRAAKLLTELPEKWPIEDGKVRWQSPKPLSAAASEGDAGTVLDDGSVRFAASGPEKATYTFVYDTDDAPIDRIRLEALIDDTLPSKGPGRTAHGNFVLGEIVITAAPKSAPEQAKPVAIASGKAEVQQDTFPIASAFDGKTQTGWAVHVPGKALNTTKTAVFQLKEPIVHTGGSRITVRLDQSHGQKHTIGRPRVSFGSPAQDGRPIAERRSEAVESAYAAWIARERARTVRWTTLRPASAKASLPLLTVQSDASVFASGDFSKSDTYEVSFTGVPRGITAVRIEVLPDDRLPKHGPGAVYYEGAAGDFFLSEFEVIASGKKLKIAKATQSFAAEKFTADKAIDGDQQSGWGINGGQGRAHEAVFQLAEPLADGGELALKMLCERYYAAGLGRFRISVTDDPRGAEAREMTDETERLLLVPEAALTAEQRSALREQFLLSAPELAAASKAIRELRKPATWQTTLVMSERPANNPRPTFIHHRGEFTQPTDRVEPAVLSVLNPLPRDTQPDRLAFARWLVSPENPLTARVVVNRAWAAFFGQGLVKTTEDFGYQSEPPTHPELLDWLAVEFVKQGWSTKKLHRLIVTSATYQQSSRVDPAVLAKDPDNLLLARFPRKRLEAEIVRDSALRAAGLLSSKMGGPPVKPPQPDGVSEVAYGSPKWDANTGEDRYRRSLYTFVKRTAPFALFNTFDAPTGEACIARRDVSNTSLQALTLLNDVVFIEAARALGKTLATTPGDDDARMRHAYIRVLSREPRADELPIVRGFLAAQRERFASGALDAKAFTGEGSEPNQAAWTALVRALFNLDEAVTKN